MAKDGSQGPVHPKVTDNSGYGYFFYTKHHAVGKSSDAQWLPTISHDEEFAVFNLADILTLANRNGDLFGLRRDEQGKILYVGTGDEQIAEFPFARENELWHGIPMWPILEGNDRKRTVVPRQALHRMVEVGLLTKSKMGRLAGGKDV